MKEKGKKYLLKDVTLDEVYKNKNMTLYGKPSDDSTLQKIFGELESMDISALESYFVPLLSPIDALRVILYKFSLCIIHYKERVILYNVDEDLHQFRVNIRKSRAFLKEFAFLLPKEQFIYFYDNLSFFAILTNKKRDLDVIKERLRKLDKAHVIIQNDISMQQEKEHQKIADMLKCDTFKDFFRTYQKRLTGETLLSTKNSRGSIKKTAKKIIKKRHRKIINKIDTLEKSVEIEKLHKIRISFKKFRYLLEEFQHVFGDKKIAEMIEKGKKLQALLGDFNDTINQKKLLHTYFKENKKEISDRKKLEKSLLSKTSTTEAKLIKKVMKRLDKFKTKALNL